MYSGDGQNEVSQMYDFEVGKQVSDHTNTELLEKFTNQEVEVCIKSMSKKQVARTGRVVCRVLCHNVGNKTEIRAIMNEIVSEFDMPKKFKQKVAQLVSSLIPSEFS